MEKKDFYAAVLKSGQFCKCKTIEEFKWFPESTVECILLARYDHTFTGPSNITDWYQFHFVDREGNPTTYRVGGFEVFYLGRDDGCTNFFGRKVSIRDCSSDKFYKYTSRVWYDTFITDEIKPLLERLNRCSGEEEIVKELKTVLSYSSLQDKMDSLQISYDELRGKYELLKKKLIELSVVFDAIKDPDDNS